MTNDFDTRCPRDTGWINLGEPQEVRYWTRVLAVTESRLRAAVGATRAIDVADPDSKSDSKPDSKPDQAG